MLVFCEGIEIQMTGDDDAYLPRPEESRVTQIDKNERMMSQLKVNHF